MLEAKENLQNRTRTKGERPKMPDRKNRKGKSRSYKRKVKEGDLNLNNQVENFSSRKEKRGKDNTR